MCVPDESVFDCSWDTPIADEAPCEDHGLDFDLNTLHLMLALVNQPDEGI